jgi:hypothetical protein
MPLIFLSSTTKDLSACRQAVREAIHKLDGYHCISMEDFGARDWEADDFCRARVAECDLIICIIGHFYGTCPKQ